MPNENGRQRVSWIRDFLPSDLPAARLLFFNYDSTTYNDAPIKDLTDIAEELLLAFQASGVRTTDHERKRPVVFLCHSYGGLVVKEALSRAAENPARHSDLFNNIYSVIFLGTPHFGTEYAGYAKELAIRLDRLGSNPDIFVPLAVNSTYLQQRHARFISLFPDLLMVNFYETRRLVIGFSFVWHFPIKAMIVPRESATFDAPNTENHPLDYDHSGLNKFNSRNDNGYVKILFILRRVTRTFIEDRRKKQQEEEKLHPSFNWNSSAENTASGLCPGPFHYIVQPSTVSSFIDRPAITYLLDKYLKEADESKDPPHSVALWGRGGTGKSQLALHYIETHRNTYNPIIWIDAESPASVIRSFSNAFEELNLDYPSNILDEQRKFSLQETDYTGLPKDWIMRSVLQWLSSRGDVNCPWLVVLDNADHLAWIRDIIPHGPRGSLIITSRDRQVRNFVSHALYVGDLNTDEALALLLSGLELPASPGQIEEPPTTGMSEKPPWLVAQDEAAFAIVENLGNDPLTVNMANAYLAQHDILRENLTLYLEMLFRQSFSVLEAHELPPNDHYRFRLATVFETSYTAINETAFSSAWLLILLAHLQSSNIEDRLFKEASTELAYLNLLYAAFNPFLIFLEISLLVWGPQLLIKLILYLLRNRRPNLRGRSRRYAVRIMTIMPLILDFIYMLTTYIIAHSQTRHGDVVKRDGSLNLEIVAMTIYMSIAYSLPRVSDWLLGEDENPWRLKVLPILYSTTVLMLWIWNWYFYGLDVIVEENTKVLMDRLDFSRTDMFQFEAMMSGLDSISRERLAYKLPVELAWLLLWRIFLQSVALVVLMIFQYAWCRLIALVVQKIESPQNILLTKLGLALLKLSGTEIGATVLAYCLGSSIGWWLGISGASTWIPWEETFCERRWYPGILNSFLLRTDEGEWDPVPYAEAMSPLTQFGLLQRTQGQGYIMHPLVQWWAQQRLPEEEKKMFVKEAYRLLDLAYQSSGCWNDVFCQQMLIPHMAEVATVDVMNDGTGYWRLKYLLKMLYRSLKKVGRM